MSQEHFFHCILFIFIILYNVDSATNSTNSYVDPIKTYGLFGSIILYVIRFSTLLSCIHMTFNFCGLIFYEAFPKRVILKGSLSHTPFLCIRVVTKGIYPTLVLENIKKNLDTCTNIGLRNFIIEVVTDKAVNPPHHEKLREIVVPSEYETKNGTLYKARALHYCWEEGINKLDDSDWVVHLDEETLLTEDAVRGILNFAMNDNHTCGQGLITYANGEIVNWLTTFADTYRVAADMGMYRFQFKAFHKSYHGWKGSYMVLKASTEKHVSFDNGLEGSIIEDGYFAIKASSKGYSFDFIEGEMWEMSPFTVLDFMKQRKRWLQGVILALHSKNLPLKNKIIFLMYFYSWISLPVSVSNYYLSKFYPIPLPYIFNAAVSFLGSVQVYMYIYGAMKSFSMKRLGYLKILLVLLTVASIPLHIIIEIMYILWAVCSDKRGFTVIEKNINKIRKN